MRSRCASDSERLPVSDVHVWSLTASHGDESLLITVHGLLYLVLLHGTMGPKTTLTILLDAGCSD